MKRLISILACVIAAGTSLDVEARRRGEEARGQPGVFDYYTLALSWSPSYCATRDDPNQCAPGRQLGFVLHGLWPQYERGYPQNCSREPIAPAVRARYPNLFPSKKLMDHEWSKHGTCSGMDANGYFALSAKFKEQVRIPQPYLRPTSPVRTSYGDIIAHFRQANPGLARDAILPFCSANGRFLSEVRVCFDRNGGSRSCGEQDVKRSRNTCRHDTFLIQSVR
jgi:ribonuclease T2